MHGFGARRSFGARHSGDRDLCVRGGDVQRNDGLRRRAASAAHPGADHRRAACRAGLELLDAHDERASVLALSQACQPEADRCCPDNPGTGGRHRCVDLSGDADRDHLDRARLLFAALDSGRPDSRQAQAATGTGRRVHRGRAIRAHFRHDSGRRHVDGADPAGRGAHRSSGSSRNRAGSFRCRESRTSRASSCSP